MKKLYFIISLSFLFSFSAQAQFMDSRAERTANQEETNTSPTSIEDAFILEIQGVSVPFKETIMTQNPENILEDITLPRGEYMILIYQEGTLLSTRRLSY